MKKPFYNLKVTKFVRLSEYNRAHGGDSIYKIYIDTYFLFNFWMNLWVLFLCRFLVASKVKRKKVIFAAVMAAIGEVLVVCLPLGNSSIKILAGFGGVTALVIFVLFQPKSAEYFYKLLSYFYLAVFILGGSFLLLENMWNEKSISMYVWGMLVVFLVFIVEKMYIKVTAKSNFRDVVLTISGNQFCSVKALVDSGNGLVEPISRRPVSVVEEKVIEEYKEFFQQEKYRLVPFHSVGKERGLLEAYFIEKMEIKSEDENWIVKNPMIAITKERISVNGSYQMILHPNMLEQGGRISDF